MGLYSKYVLPKIVHFVCGRKPFMHQRERVVPLAGGRVLEIGAGSGLNLPLYNAERVKHLWALEPAPEMWSMAESRLDPIPFPVEWIESGAEDIPLEDASVDCVLVTYSLCTIPEVVLALEQMRRVLRGDGQFIFCEHGRSPDRRVQDWQDRLNPMWMKCGGGCNLNRDIPKLIKDSGFRIAKLRTKYLPGWKPATYNFWGHAVSGKTS